MLKLADVIEALTGIKPEHASLVISEAVIDSRQVIPGSMFVALPGERVDGHDYLESAFIRGAAFALVQKDMSQEVKTIQLNDTPNFNFDSLHQPFCIQVPDTLKAMQAAAKFWRSKLPLKVIGITGSIGKSTTKELAAELLDRHYRTAKNYGNLNNEIGLPLSILRLTDGYERAVLEMGFYLPGEISLLCEIATPEIGIVTNIGPVHAERAGSLEVITKGKTELVQALPPHGWAILNIDDPLVRSMAEHTKARIFFYGLSPKADLWADNIEGLGMDGLRFSLHYQRDVINLKVPLIGKHAIHTILRSVALALVEQLSWDEIITGLQYGRSQLRMVVVKMKNGVTLLDDSYNSSPDSALAALDLLSEMEGFKVAVLGDMLELGSFEKAGHLKVGTRVAETCSKFIAIGHRSKIMVDAAVEAGMKTDNIEWYPDVPEAIRSIDKLFNAGDVVLVKGSLGMGMARIVTAMEKAE